MNFFENLNFVSTFGRFKIHKIKNKYVFIVTIKLPIMKEIGNKQNSMLIVRRSERFLIFINIIN